MQPIYLHCTQYKTHKIFFLIITVTTAISIILALIGFVLFKMVKWFESLKFGAGTAEEHVRFSKSNDMPSHKFLRFA